MNEITFEDIHNRTSTCCVITPSSPVTRTIAAAVRRLNWPLCLSTSEELNPVAFLRTFSSALLTLGEGEEESEEGPPAWN
jgi:hypothetical protein